MAKQLVNPLERHAEKLVLAVAALVLIGVVVKYLFSSPNKINFGNEPVTPSAIDARLAQTATEVLDRIRNAKPQIVEHDPVYDDFVAALTPLRSESLPAAVAIGPEVPLIDTPEGVAGRAALVKVARPEKPVYTTGRNTLLQVDPQGGELRQPTDWVTLSAAFDVKTQSDQQRRTWGATKADVIFVPPEVQRRMIRRDGSWSDEDWQTVKSWPAYNLPTPPPIRLIQDGSKVMTPKEDQKAAEKLQDDLSDPKAQLRIVRPMPPTVVDDGKRWAFPVITTYEDVVKQDAEYLSQADSSAGAEDRYGLKQAEPSKAAKAPKTRAEELNQQIEDARVQLDAARKSGSKDGATRVYNDLFGIVNGRDTPPDIKHRAELLQKDANLLIQDIEHGRAGPKSTQTAAKPDDKPKPLRDKLPRQQLWVHDWAADSITNGATYQYRIRWRVLNRLAGFPESFEDPKNAGLWFLESEWSEPTDPIAIPPASWFFVTRDDQKRHEIGVEFFRWYDGVWVASDATKFNEGQALFVEQRVPVPNKADRTVADTPLVSFEGDAVLLDIDFARPFREKKVGSSAAGVKFGPPNPVTAAVFVDSKGALEERLMILDKNSPKKKDLQGMKWAPTKK